MSVFCIVEDFVDNIADIHPQCCSKKQSCTCHAGSCYNEYEKHHRG